MADEATALRLQRAAAAGIRLWNGQPFDVVVDQRGNREAHFRVQWIPNLGGAQIGIARTQWSAGEGLTVRSIALVTQSPDRGLPIASSQVRLTAAHEMGHALGLPHSDQDRDVMYPLNTASALTARDYRTLEALYALEDGTEIVR
jgi:predicted Zn-dependent protease